MKWLFRFYSHRAHNADAHLFLFIVLFAVFFLSHAITKGEKKKRRRKKKPTISLFLSEGCLHSTQKNNVLYVQMSSFNSVFYSCTNCLPNSVLYSCEHKQGFILYCISTHWTIILMRDCKENLLERIIRTLCVRFVWGPLVGAVKFESQRIFFLKKNAYTICLEKQLWILWT